MDILTHPKIFSTYPFSLSLTLVLHLVPSRPNRYLRSGGRNQIAPGSPVWDTPPDRRPSRRSSDRTSVIVGGSDIRLTRTPTTPYPPLNNPIEWGFTIDRPW